ncbi:MgtC/SapB family protein [Segetibacter sp.]|jgi:putative Mg2+ transporter-C (MgtC) family protein|uniref:MgtC/SapB family protein n=1 Tax=Segetibacter sp. TaxID=2231182 RepID=UPI0026026A37|nr:MgtC/SapB family protein [Segetibacter sp.]MCW3080408.1 MgtC/SapB transporter [Segetibacter sp.]
MQFLLEREDFISIGMSILCGGIIGFEREYNNKSAGFRTIILISLGSTIFTIVSKHGTGSDDRIAANIITGIGFIGAGVIFKDKLSVLGLTTAAVIWTTAGIGMATGIGYHALAFCLTVFTIIVLSVFGKIESVIELFNHSKTVSFIFENAEMKNVYAVEEVLKAMKMKSKRVMMNKNQGRLLLILNIKGTEKQFAELSEVLVKTESITEFH